MVRSSLSLADLAERHRPELLAYLVRMLGDEHDAQDVCQDTFLRAQRAFALGRANSRASVRRETNRGTSNSASQAGRCVPR